MLLIKYILLGIIQGLTEFLPVSSSAHLLIFRQILQLQENPILLEIVLHLGTLFALVVFLFKDIKKILKVKLSLLLLLATALTAGIVVIGREFFESMFTSAGKLSVPLLITGLMLLATKGFSTKAKRTFTQLNPTDAIWVGLIQGFTVIPGLSRSGITISTLLFRNIEKESAFRFSLLLSILAILGALVFKIKDFSYLNFGEIRYMLAGFLFSFFSGLLALKILISAIRQARFHLFGYYCLALALVLFFLK